MSINTNDYRLLKTLEDRMNQNLFGQPEAVHYVANMIKRIETGFCIETRPRGVLVFAGPTGVGKTELAKMTAYEMGVPLIRYDMSEFSESHKVSRLLGSPAGYVNSGDGGELINKLRANPACVVLFDEIEKAHRNTYKIFLQLFDEGRITDSMGNEVIATQAVFILTTNLGSAEIYQQLKRGIRENIDERMRELCIRTFSTELYNRFDKVIVFNPINQAVIEKIVLKHLGHLRDTLEKTKLELAWDPQVVHYFTSLILDVNLGARDLHRKINDKILPLLATNRIEGKILLQEVKVRIDIADGQLKLTVLDQGRCAGHHIEQRKKPVKSSEALVLRDGVVYIDQRTKRSLKEYEGKYVYRGTTSVRGHLSDNCIKIIHVASNGEIVFMDRDLGDKEVRRYLPSSGDDGEWLLATPAKDGQAFFENLATILEPTVREEARTKIRSIFSGLSDRHSMEGYHLSEDDPFDSLVDYCYRRNRKDDAVEVMRLKNLIGPISVITTSKETTQNRLRPKL